MVNETGFSIGTVEVAYALQYTVVLIRDDVSVLVLDTRDLTVAGGSVNGEAAQLSLQEPHKVNNAGGRAYE